jgi:hypothetical protein
MEITLCICFGKNKIIRIIQLNVECNISMLTMNQVCPICKDKIWRTLNKGTFRCAGCTNLLFSLPCHKCNEGNFIISKTRKENNVSNVSCTVCAHVCYLSVCQDCFRIIFFYKGMEEVTVCDDCLNDPERKYKGVHLSREYRKDKEFDLVYYNQQPFARIERACMGSDVEVKGHKTEILMAYIDSQIKPLNDKIEKLTAQLEKLLTFIEFSPDGGPEFLLAQERWNKSTK